MKLDSTNMTHMYWKKDDPFKIFKRSVSVVTISIIFVCSVYIYIYIYIYIYTYILFVEMEIIPVSDVQISPIITLSFSYSKPVAEESYLIRSYCTCF